MTTIEDRLADAARTLQRDVRRTVDVETALAQVVDLDPARALVRADGRSRPPVGPLLLAAALVVLVAVAGALLVDDDAPLVLDGAIPPSTSSTAAAPVAGDLPFRLLGTVPGSRVPGGTITYAGIEDAYADQWSAATDARRPPVAFDREIVLTLTVTEWTDCPIRLIGLARDEESLVLRLGSPPGGRCGPGTATRTTVVAIDRGDLPSAFTVVLPAAPDASYPEQAVELDLSTRAQTHAPAPTGGPDPVSYGPDLQAPAPGREITFEGMGDVRLGQRLEPSEVQQYEGGPSCGYWGPQEPSHDGDEPAGGLVSGADGPAPRVWTIMAREGSTYRTASGVGVGTTLATLQRVYAERLVVDRADASQTATDGLVGWYQDVAAVRLGDHALTFYLRGDVVHTVKLSPADVWGDDEGCA